MLPASVGVCQIVMLILVPIIDAKVNPMTHSTAFARSVLVPPAQLLPSASGSLRQGSLPYLRRLHRGAPRFNADSSIRKIGLYRSSSASAAAEVASGDVPPAFVASADDFVLKLDDTCRVTVIHNFLPLAEADLLRDNVPKLCAAQLCTLGSRKSAVYFDEPARDYFFTGRRWLMDENGMMPASIASAKRAVAAITGEKFNGAVVNVYDTPNAQIKWHDDGEYSYVSPATVACFSLFSP